MIFLRLFYEFFTTGLFAIGGGLATLPFLSQMGAKTGWFTQAELMDMLAVSESTPGPVGVNMATFTGYKIAGIPGSFLAVFALVLPSVIIILLIAKMMDRYLKNRFMQAGLTAIRPASMAMITQAGLGVAMLTLIHWDAFKLTEKFTDLVDLKAWALGAALFALLKLTKWHPIFIILIAAAVGIVLYAAGIPL